ncbi:MAG: 30S ribosomal protein S4 [Candidatus Omnitrophica bacterium CG08_land_8_20_14_0_20_41_16]|uniref:Small ribosomal subunit protein uS4 n=1 Tax=Candidatus Sherwoodlollariibacterium unditelluris TaxID=1974757 RepID=A0A2G9YHD5_9BACT|nr:MAG: 30S ribosomal protein S4 [Candidatus Omnitrophica bacterium CG23_combo_of_CG06-09_8_20_14_all_41_10]PIS33820.1 MAG: 30S ribosomal protein S4 [Candidatus Omnitrophica bacterium CG08_land_8_20_14_0_20_41_16]
MARYTDAVCRLCRRQGEKLFLKGTKCTTEKCPANKRAYAPGQHGESRNRRRKISNYGLQLREKQKVKRIYGVLEKQFRRYFKIASKAKGITGRVLLQLLERRLDNVIFRAGIGISRSQARQIVRHNFIFVNSKRVNIPSFLVDKDDLVQVKAKEKALNKIKDNLELSKDRAVPSWIEFKPVDFSAKVLRLPEKDDIGQTIQEQLIVELYSK